MNTKLGVVQQHVTKTAHHYGIESLLDELLASIFSVLAADETANPLTTFKRMVSLALVNRRFRNVLYDTAECWSNFDTVPHSMKCRLANILLERSREAPLKFIYICDDDFTLP